MAVIGSKPRSHLINTDKYFRDLAKSGLLRDFRTPVAKNTYPKWGIDHPTMAIGDNLEFVTKHTSKRLVVFNSEDNYRITNITLERDVHTHEWDWCIEFGSYES